MNQLDLVGYATVIGVPLLILQIIINLLVWFFPQPAQAGSFIRNIFLFIRRIRPWLLGLLVATATFVLGILVAPRETTPPTVEQTRIALEATIAAVNAQQTQIASAPTTAPSINNNPPTVLPVPPAPTVPTAPTSVPEPTTVPAPTATPVPPTPLPSPTAIPPPTPGPTNTPGETILEKGQAWREGDLVLTLYDVSYCLECGPGSARIDGTVQLRWKLEYTGSSQKLVRWGARYFTARDNREGSVVGIKGFMRGPGVSICGSASFLMSSGQEIIPCDADQPLHLDVDINNVQVDEVFVEVTIPEAFTKARWRIKLP